MGLETKLKTGHLYIYDQQGDHSKDLELQQNTYDIHKSRV